MNCMHFLVISLITRIIKLSVYGYWYTTAMVVTILNHGKV